jgi:hypothetical protein
MKESTRPLLACLALGLVLQGCSKSSDNAKQSPNSGSDAASTKYPDGAVELKIKWPVGRRQVHRMELKQKSSTHLPQRQEPMQQDVGLVQEYAVSVLQDRQPAGRELELEYLYASMDVSMNNRSIFSFDSSGESLDSAPNPMASYFRTLVGMRLKLLMDTNDHVESVEGLDGFLNKLVQNAPPRGREVMTNMFSEETFKQMVEFGRGLPSHPVRPGDTWSSTNHIAMGAIGQLTLNVDYTFKNWDTREGRACALVEFTGDMESSNEGGTGPMGMKMQMKDGKLSGQSWFSPDLGLPVDATIDQTMTMLVTAQIPKFGDRGGGIQTFPSELKQSIKIKLVELSGE